MLLAIDRHNGVPAYRQILDQIRFQVASGVLAAGDELPSTRNLSADLGVNPMTVSKAYGLLEREGIAERRPGLSLVVRAVPAERARDGKVEELRRSLAPVVTVARQLGVDREQLIEVLDELLGDEPADGRRGAPEGERS
jgi:GntR family transcriptional regulator